jgi:putative transcriptional regulator
MARRGSADGRANGDAASGDAGANSARAPIAVRLDGMLADRGMTLTELAERVGITIVNLSILKNGRARAIRFTTLASLCEVLGCQPGDLLSYLPNGRPREGTADGAPPG